MKILIILFLLFNLYFCKDTLTGSLSTFPGRIGVKTCWTCDKIHYVYPGSPAEKSGLRKGDHIIMVKDESGSKEITGASGTIVTLTIRRDDIVLDPIEIERVAASDPVFRGRKK